ncbi:MAG TPA: formate C-acetyltransferase/glycerol dehydratase family glycyl radical enzyme [Bacteroidales bacterium]|nr:formate C-acetyltransferase/glycerol dehydratase family glycyl radical enzyme [Bacteroidales bacterium]
MEASLRINSLKTKTISAQRFLSVEQARIITRIYRENENAPVIMKRALSLAVSLRDIHISIDPEEIIVGNRTSEIRAGVVFPEAGISWLLREIDTLPSRPQDPFNVRDEDKAIFLQEIAPYWKGKTLEDDILDSHGEEIRSLEKVVKINQKDHAQGHICPMVSDWLSLGPSGLISEVDHKLQKASGEEKLFYESVILVLEGARGFMKRYASLALKMTESFKEKETRDNLEKISEICKALADRPPETFREAVQSVWFLFVILQMESNASSFSPGRMDQYLLPFYESDLRSGVEKDSLQEIIDALYVKFNQIVYMRNSNSARYFAGFPTGFNVTIGGQNKYRGDATNDLSFMFLKAEDHTRMPQPNLTARLHDFSPDSFIDECSRVIGLGTGMPQIANDNSIIPALEKDAFEEESCLDYVLVGCVEISPQGNYLGFSDAAMFNMVKVLELTLNEGKCLITGEQIGLKTDGLGAFENFDDLEIAMLDQMDHFIRRMIAACIIVQKCHEKHLPSPFLSSVVRDCIDKGRDITSGGSELNDAGIQAIQVANLADSLAVLKKLVFDDKICTGRELLDALRTNFAGNEILRQICINGVEKYGNDVKWVDEMGAKWIRIFYDNLFQHESYLGGMFKPGLYTVSAHVPMGQNVGATPDGRLSGTPLADGGLSPMYGRDKNGPTAVLNSVARIPSILAPNGTLLNMKFLPSMFSDEDERKKFSCFLKGFIRLPVHHIQFNVVTAEELIRAKNDPQNYRGLTIRVAGYTAYFTELAPDLQDEIIKRTTQEGQ